MAKRIVENTGIAPSEAIVSLPSIPKPNFRVRCRVSVTSRERGLERVYVVVDLTAKDPTEAKIRAKEVIERDYEVSNKKVEDKLDSYSPEPLG